MLVSQARQSLLVRQGSAGCLLRSETTLAFVDEKSLTNSCQWNLGDWFSGECHQS